jgi:diadenosine tetraphosphate (Ap4A) HIT family hydrolase
MPPPPPVTAEDLRTRLHDALTREHYRRARERIKASPEDHCAAFTDVVLTVLAGDSGDLLRQMAEAIDETWMSEDDFDAQKAAAAAMSVRWKHEAQLAGRWGDATRRAELAETRLEHALAELSSLRDHRARWETEKARADKAEYDLEIRTHTARSNAKAQRIAYLESEKQRQRAEQAEAELDEMEGVVTDLGVVRLELQAVIERVIRYLDGIEAHCSTNRKDVPSWVRSMRAALATPTYPAAAADEDAPCPFCDRSQADVVGESFRFYARRDAFPATEGHTLIVPKRHVASFAELTPTEVAEAFGLLREVCARLDEEHGPNGYVPDGYNIGISDGRAAGRTVHHLHIHLIPRRWGDQHDPRGGIRRGLPGWPLDGGR